MCRILSNLERGGGRWQLKRNSGIVALDYQGVPRAQRVLCKNKQALIYRHLYRRSSNAIYGMSPVTCDDGGERASRGVAC